MRLKQAVVYLEPVDTCPYDSDLMSAFIPDPAELELTPDATEAAEAAAPDLNSASIFGIFWEFSGWVEAERQEAFRVKTSGRA